MKTHATNSEYSSYGTRTASGLGFVCTSTSVLPIRVEALSAAKGVAAMPPRSSAPPRRRHPSKQGGSEKRSENTLDRHFRPRPKL
eukprot:scaffold299977_cov24-Prasinocladus_malaysianus.AAC.1